MPLGVHKSGTKSKPGPQLSLYSSNTHIKAALKNMHFLPSLIEKYNILLAVNGLLSLYNS
jgi:hypothetical protein